MTERPDEATREDPGLTPPRDREGLRAWWTATVESHLTALYRFVRLRVPDGAVDDVVQDVFVSAAGSLSRFDPDRGAVWAWLTGIARNTIAQYYRQTRSRPPLADALDWLADGDGRVERALESETALPDEICQRGEFRRLATVALNSLEPRHRACLMGRYFEDLSLEQLGRRMGLSRSAANSLLHRARGELRDAFFSLMGETTNAKENGP